MDNNIKERWLSALRSGEYKQTKNILKDDEGFCCLGVLCDLAVKDGVIGPWYRREPVNDYTLFSRGFHGEGYYEDATLPVEVLDWAGLDDSNPMVDLGDFNPVPISDPNDNGYTFDQIADLIDRQL